MTTDGRRHPGIFKQVDQLVAASEAAPDLAYMGRQLTLCCLPRTNPGDKSQYLRQNGPYQLGMAAGPGYKLPYGTLPRLVLVWLCSEATQTQSRILTLGDSFLDFMHQIGITDNSGGKRSYRTRLADQMERLFNSSVQMSYRTITAQERWDCVLPNARSSGGTRSGPAIGRCGRAQSN